MASVVLWFVALSGMVTATAPAVRAQVDAGTDSLGTARVLSRGLDSPSGMALDGDMLLVSNAEGGFANNGFVPTELDASTGKVIRVISGSGYRFNSPSSLATAGGAVYVTSPGSSASASGSVTVLNASSGVVRVVAGASYRFEGPGPMVVSGEHLFVLDSGTYNLPGSITEVNTATGKLIRVISGPSYELSAPDGIVLERGDLFISDSDLGKGGSV